MNKPLPIEFERAFINEIEETIAFLSDRIQSAFCADAESGEGGREIRYTAKEIAAYVLLETLRGMKGDSVRHLREKESWKWVKSGSVTLYRTVAINRTILWLDVDVTALPKGVHKAFLYKFGLTEAIPDEDELAAIGKIPAILFVGDYRCFDCFDNAEYILMVYPGCYFVSKDGRSWHIFATTEGNLYQIIKGSSSLGCDA